MTFRLAALALAGTLLPAATTTYWEISNFSEFAKGRFESISLTRDGRLALAPKTDTMFASDQPVIWSVAQAGADTYYVATGHRGEVHRVSAGKTELLWKAPEPEVFAIAAAPNGVVYAGTSPDGKVYRIENGKASEYFAPKAKFIWALAVAPDGSLYVATGDEGKIFRVTASGQGEAWYETGQTHVTCLAFDREGRLLAGSEPNGILYRITAKDKAFVLYDANMPEIRAIVPAADGSLYVAALGGAPGPKAAGAQGAVSAAATAVVAAQPTTITVTDTNAQAGPDVKPKPEQPKTAAPAATVTTVVSPIVDYSGVDRSALYRIAPDNLVETLWVSKEENIYDLAPVGNTIYFATDSQGRVYKLEQDRKATLLVETREGEATRLMPHGRSVIAATSHAGKLLRIADVPAPVGTYESPVHDAGAAARWGRISWHGDAPKGSKVVLRTRSGNSARPDQTWSDWSAPIESSGSPVSSPNARYIQWKAELSGAQPLVDDVAVAYLPMNTPPVVKSINVTSQASTATTAARPAASATASYSITVTDGASSTATSAGTPTQTVSRVANGQLVITWQAEDTDGDRLSYTVFFRGEDEREWKQIKTNVTDLALTLDGDSLADGKYLFRVLATDAPSNASGAAREADLVSAPVLVDNTPPMVTASGPKRENGAAEIAVEASDQASAVRRLEFAIDAGPWTPVAPEDGVADSLRERFVVKTPALAAGEHVVVIRAFDSAGNAGLAKLVLR